MMTGNIANERLPSKIQGLYALQQHGVMVPPFKEVFCSMDTVDLEIEDMLRDFEIPAEGLSVRSASAGEDTSRQANAGRYLSFNGLTGKAGILTAAAMILQDHFQKTQERNCYLIIQHTIASVFSGVAFASFDNADSTEMLVESFFGSCRTTVDGAAMPYRSQYSNGLWQHARKADESISIFTVHPAVFDLTGFDEIETGSLLRTSIEHFPRMARLFSATSDAEIKVYAQMPLRVPQPYALQIESLAGIVEKLRDKYPAGIDMEWGIDALNNLYIFQARHLTRPLQQRAARDWSSESPGAIAEGETVYGIPASEGSAAGIIVYEHSPAAPEANANRILMLYEATVDNTDKLDEYAGVISVLGGMLCHLAIVCREKSIPCIVGIEQMITEGRLVNLDARKGIITIEQLAQQ